MGLTRLHCISGSGILEGMLCVSMQLKLYCILIIVPDLSVGV